jgi:hypothetical protein
VRIGFIYLTRIEERAVLLYCTEEFRSLECSCGLSFYSMKDENDNDDNFLRRLDAQDSSTGFHALVIASGPFGVRGFEYRAALKGITWIIAGSFAN